MESNVCEICRVIFCPDPHPGSELGSSPENNNNNNNDNNDDNDNNNITNNNDNSNNCNRNINNKYLLVLNDPPSPDQ